MYSYRSLLMAEQKQDDQLEHTYSSYVRIRDVALKTCWRRWMIGRSGERGSRISVLAARYDDDDDYTQELNINTFSVPDVTIFRIFGGFNGYHRRKWTRQHEFKTWTRLIAFHITLIPLGKVWIQLFSLQLWVNSRADWFLQPWWRN